MRGRRGETTHYSRHVSDAPDSAPRPGTATGAVHTGATGRPLWVAAPGEDAGPESPERRHCALI